MAIGPVDEARCAQQPLHVSGSIQSHGVLIVLARADLTIAHVSANIEDICGAPAASVCGSRIAAILGEAQAGRLEGALHEDDLIGYNPTRLAIEVLNGERRDFECVVHGSDVSFIVEMQPLAGPDAGDELHFSSVRKPIERFEGAPDAASLVRCAPAEVQRITGYDRAMIYRFNEDWHGQVIAEATSGPDVPVSYLGLHFPASDIPEQARQRCLAIRIRVIADVARAPAPLVPEVDAMNGAPVDLSSSILRGVSPHHIEYLHNMGVRASMSISIVVAGRLWGLIVCHHLAPRSPNYTMRSACVLLGDVLGRQLESRIKAVELDRELHAKALIASVGEALDGHDELAPGLSKAAQELLRLFSAQGLVVRVGPTTTKVGVPPADDAVVARIVAALRPSLDGGVAIRNTLSEIGTQPAPAAGGALLITLSASGDDYLLFTRPAIPQDEYWGGDVRSRVTGSAGRFQPRKSFVAWKEIVGGTRAPWSPLDIENAQRLRQKTREHQERVQQRKDAEALRQSQAFLERTGKVAGIGGWEVDLLTRKQTWSVQTRQIIGLATELSLEDGLKLYPPEARPIMNAAFERAASTGEGFDLELPFVCSDGSRIWVRAVGGAELRDGKPVRVVGAFQDVTVRVAERQALQTSNERFTLATASGGIGIYEWDVGSGELIWDAQMHRLYGLDPSEAVPDMEQWRRFVHPEDLAALEQAAHDAIAADTPFQREFRIIWRDGSEHVLKASGHVERAADDQALRFVGANWDITQARRLAADIEEQRNLLHVTLASINDAVITTDAFGNIRWLNPVAELMTGYSLADAQTRPAEAILNIVHEVTREPLGSAIASCLARKTMERTELGILISRSGNEFAIEESASPIRNARGELLGVVLVFHDVTKLRRLSSEASYRAAHDALTGLPNRAALLDLMQHSVNEAKRDGSIFAILFVDLDHFKLYNDSFGHATGDRILKVAGTRLQRSLRHHDVVARLGGDEFVIIYRELLNATDAERLANKLIATLAEPIVIQNAPEIRITASVGVAVFPNDGRDAETLLHNADLAMYRAKGHGRNGVAHYLASAALNTHDSIHEARRVTKGLAGNEFVAYYQPIIDLQSGRVATMEALARWMHPTRGLILPERFIPVAERSGTIFKLGRSILRQACIRASQWIGIYGPQAPRVSVNVSPSQFRDEDFLGIISEALAESGLPSDRLQLEVTESLLIEDEAHTIAMLHALADSGVTIAIDDFGTGYSSLSYLTRLPVDVIKIDKSFITGLTTVPERSAIVRAIIAMSRSLRMGVVAEGVEDYAPASFLRDEGCTGIQGFVIQRALSGSDAVAFIESFDGRGFIRKIAAR